MHVVYGRNPQPDGLRSTRARARTSARARGAFPAMTWSIRIGAETTWAGSSVEEVVLEPKTGAQTWSEFRRDLAGTCSSK